MVNHLSWYQEATEDINQLSTNVLTGGFLMFSGGIEVEHWLKMVKQKFPEKKGTSPDLFKSASFSWSNATKKTKSYVHGKANQISRLM